MKNDITLENAKSILLNSVISGIKIENLIALGEELLNNPIVLCTYNHFIWYVGEIPKNCTIPDFEGAVVDITELNNSTSYYYNFNDLIFDKLAIGYSILISSYKVPTDDQLLHKAFCEILTSYLSKNKIISKYLPFTKIETLLMRTLQEPDYLQFNYSDLDELLPTSKYLEFIVCGYKDKSTKYAPGINIITNISDIIKADICFGYLNYIVIVVPFGTARLLHKNMETILKQYGLIAGVSYPFLKSKNLTMYFNQAEDIITRNNSNNCTLNYYSDCILQKVTYISNEHYPLESLCRFDILNLKNYDISKNTELTKTFRIYFETGFNIRKTAEILNIHRNTALARIEKIKYMLFDNDAFSLNGYYSTVLMTSINN